MKFLLCTPAFSEVSAEVNSKQGMKFYWTLNAKGKIAKGVFENEVYNLSCFGGWCRRIIRSRLAGVQGEFKDSSLGNSAKSCFKSKERWGPWTGMCVPSPGFSLQYHQSLKLLSLWGSHIGWAAWLCISWRHREPSSLPPSLGCFSQALHPVLFNLVFLIPLQRNNTPSHPGKGNCFNPFS